MKISSTFTPRDGAEWRAWLSENHATQGEVWVVYFKQDSGQTGIDYESSVQEALCFGWVDSIIQKIDEQRYARKFNPRRAGSFWSASNKQRMDKLIREGRMTPAGLEKYDPGAPGSSSEFGQQVKRAELPTPEWFSQALAANPRAQAYFQSLAPGQQRQYAAWVVSAKKVETQQKRLAEVLARLEQGLKPELK